MTGFKMSAGITMIDNGVSTNSVHLDKVSLVMGDGFRENHVSIYSSEDVRLELRSDGSSTCILSELGDDGMRSIISVQTFTAIDSWAVNHLTEDGTEENYFFDYNFTDRTWEITSEVMEED